MLAMLGRAILMPSSNHHPVIAGSMNQLLDDDVCVCVQQIALLFGSSQVSIRLQKI